MPDTPTSVAILFADMEGSTKLYDTLGDIRARSIMAQCLDWVIDAVKQNGGSVVKTIGDEVMCTFPQADQAAEAARGIQQSMLENQQTSELKVGVQVGLHFGPVLEEQGDVYGDAVNVAARMVGMAKPGQILTTETTVNGLSPSQRTGTRRIDRRQLRGKQAQVEIFEVIWQTANLTTVVELRSIADRSTEARLVVSMGGREWSLGAERTRITIGRETANDLVLDDLLASRFHAHLELRQEKFLVVDNSTNGTLVRPSEGEPIYVHREELMLPETGTIGVGPPGGTGDLESIRFQLQRS